MHINFKYREFHNFVNDHNENNVFVLYDSNASKKERIKLVKATQFKNIEIDNKNEKKKKKNKKK